MLENTRYQGALEDQVEDLESFIDMLCDLGLSDLPYEGCVLKIMFQMTDVDNSLMVKIL